MSDNALINRFSAAMQAGANGEAEIRALFTGDAEYVEPFSGRSRTHRGLEAVIEVMREGWRDPMPNMTIVVDRALVANS